MSNFKIENLTSSVLDLSSIRDVHKNPVTLRPKGGPGASREIAASDTTHEAVESVVRAKWASLTKIERVAVPVTPPPEMKRTKDVLPLAPEQPPVVEVDAPEETPTVTEDVSVVEVAPEIDAHAEAPAVMEEAPAVMEEAPPAEEAAPAMEMPVEAATKPEMSSGNRGGRSGRRNH